MSLASIYFCTSSFKADSLSTNYFINRLESLFKSSSDAYSLKTTRRSCCLALSVASSLTKFDLELWIFSAQTNISFKQFLPILLFSSSSSCIMFSCSSSFFISSSCCFLSAFLWRSRSRLLSNFLFCSSSYSSLKRSIKSSSAPYSLRASISAECERFVSTWESTFKKFC